MAIERGELGVVPPGRHQRVYLFQCGRDGLGHLLLAGLIRSCAHDPSCPGRPQGFAGECDLVERELFGADGAQPSNWVWDSVSLGCLSVVPKTELKGATLTQK